MTYEELRAEGTKPTEVTRVEESKIEGVDISISFNKIGERTGMDVSVYKRRWYEVACCNDYKGLFEICQAIRAVILSPKDPHTKFKELCITAMSEEDMEDMKGIVDSIDVILNDKWPIGSLSCLYKTK